MAASIKSYVNTTKNKEDLLFDRSDEEKKFYDFHFTLKKSSTENLSKKSLLADMYVKLTVRDGNAVLIECGFDSFLHIIENIPILIAGTPDKACEID